MAQTVDQVYSSLAGVYDPQTTLLNQQINQANVDATAQMSSLDQAKVNAFRDIGNSANAKGMLFSGFTPDQQAQYIGTKYLPAVANLKSATLNTKNTLAAKIAQLNAQRRQDAEGTVAAQQKAEQDQAYRDAQLSLGYARLNSSNANAAASRALRGSSGPSVAANKAQVQQQIMGQVSGLRGRDGYVSNETFAGALQDFIGSGLGNVRDFWHSYGQYVNPKYKSSYAGYNQR